MRPTVTILDVARHARVAPATVSRVLNGNYPVAPATRARVEKAIRELSYVRNAHAQALRAVSTGVVGVIIHDVTDPYFSEIVAGIQEVAAEKGRLVVLCNSLRDPRSESRYIEMLRGQRVDAVILAGGAIPDPEYLRDLRRQALALAAQGSGIITCGRYELTADAVLPDNARGAYVLTRHLLERGHRRIAEISGPPGLSTTEDRSAGHAQALGEAGLSRDPSLSVSGGFSRDGGYQAARRLLALGASFTAICAANDLMALGALAALREAGLGVPSDVSLVGYDDLPIISDVVPGITTIRVPMREMGRRCMRLALDGPRKEPRVEVLPVELVERESVAVVT
jgi:LacI family transcriptional regulator, galactose operon repressor